MAEVLLFHHALGLTDGVRSFADDLRAAGHSVVTPDLYDGATYDSIDDGVAHAERVGFEVIAERGAEFAAALGDRLVVAGFSLGVLPAQRLAQTRPGVAGAVLYHDAVPISTFGDRWPAGVGLQIHVVEDDEWADLDTARSVAEQAGGELFVYPGSAHLVADPGSGDYDAAAAGLFLSRTLDFLVAT
jgi:dienelactone hydrolase